MEKAEQFAKRNARMSVELCCEIIEEILIRCPVKSLSRFMCVSKSWHSIITSPNFISRQTKHGIITHKTNPSDDTLLFVRERGFYYRSFDYVFVAEQDKLSIDIRKFQMDLPTTSNGIYFRWSLVGISYGMISVYNNQSRLFMLWNPAICKYVTLPSQCVSPYVTRHWRGVGFWFDEYINDYKLIRVVHGTPIVAEMYELKKNACRVLDSAPKGPPRGKAVLLNGALHWIDAEIKLGLRPIIIFDVKDECFKEMNLLPFVHLEDSYLKLGILEGCLCVHHYYHGCQDIWVMKEYGVVASWTKQYCGLSHWMNVIGTSKDRKLLLVLFGGTLMEYDPETQVISSVIREFNKLCFLTRHCYVETLTLLNGLH